MAARATFTRIADDLRQAVEQGQLKPGFMLPSELSLAERYAASRGTVRSALKLLSDEGIIEVVPGRGRRVAGSAAGVVPSTAWGRVAEALRARLDSGEFTVEQPLPSESALVAEFGVSRNTVRRAYRHLAEAGVVVVRHGAGAFPAPR